MNDHRENGRRQPLWRSVGLPALAVTIIVAAIWLLDSGEAMPFFGDGSDGGTADFYSLESQGIELGPASGPQAELNGPAPEFTLLDLAGQPVSLGGFRGKTVLINFWATWCVPCRREMPDLQEAYESRGDQGLVVLGVNLREAKPQAQKFVDDYGVTFPILLDTSGDVAQAYRLSGVPESWIVDEEGILVRRKIGAFTTEELRIVLDESLGPQP